MPASPQRRFRRRLILLGIYVGLVLASHVWRWIDGGDPPLAPGTSSIELRAVSNGDRRLDDTARIVYRDTRPDGIDDPPVVVLLHGSPGSLHDFDGLTQGLAQDHRVLSPSLPGFDASQRDVPDYSIRAHADYVLQLLDKLAIDRVHLVSFSMGGGVALHIYDAAPDRVESLSMVASIGVQELELLGHYQLNHLIHGLQLVGLWVVHELTPHFGWLDDSMLSVEYCRNFYDTDQRPLRSILGRFEPPAMIVHGPEDPLVPYAAAQEHHRLMPHSELVTFQGGSHFFLWSQTAKLAATLNEFLSRVEAGAASRRADATAERLAAASRSIEESPVLPAHGMSLVILVLLIVAGTFITEDLTCIATGLLIVQGRLPLEVGFLACFCGIYFGDQLLYFAGRVLGRATARKAPWKWFVSEYDLEQAASWFERRGMMAIILTRFVPGTRLPTYVMAGIVKANYLLFALYFFVAVALWTPALLGLSILVGNRAEVLWTRFQHYAFFVILAAVFLILVALRLVIPAFSHRGRRLLKGRWRRLRQWEFWPMWAFYPPVALYVLWLALKHRSFAVVTAVNPAIPTGGFVGESKYEILQGLGEADGFIARTLLLKADTEPGDRMVAANSFMASEGLDFPIVLKPDQGQRGEGVSIIRDEDTLEQRLGGSGDLILQEFVAGPEFGIFYMRVPGEEKGRIFSITEKRLPHVTGDGHSTLERLILDDERAVCMARVYFAGAHAELGHILVEGEQRSLVEVGTHCLGAIFLDGERVHTPELEARIDAISRDYEGFYFGRYDVRCESEEALRRGKGFKILELNGLTSEATHIYDPANGLGEAYRVLFEQWRLAFEIAARNRAKGVKPMSSLELLKRTVQFYTMARKAS